MPGGGTRNAMGRPDRRPISRLWPSGNERGATSRTEVGRADLAPGSVLALARKVEAAVAVEDVAVEAPALLAGIQEIRRDFKGKVLRERVAGDCVRGRLLWSGRFHSASTDGVLGERCRRGAALKSITPAPTSSTCARARWSGVARSRIGVGPSSRGPVGVADVAGEGSSRANSAGSRRSAVQRQGQRAASCQTSLRAITGNRGEPRRCQARTGSNRSGSSTYERRASGGS